MIETFLNQFFYIVVGMYPFYLALYSLSYEKNIPSHSIDVDRAQ